MVELMPKHLAGITRIQLDDLCSPATFKLMPNLTDISVLQVKELPSDFLWLLQFPMLTRLTIREELRLHTFNRQIASGSFTTTTITSLNLGSAFNHPLLLGALPPQLKQLVLSVSFDQPLEIGTLPQTLEKLVFGSSFNRPILVGSLPPSIEVLQFGDSFDHPLVQDTLPPFLKQLVFKSSYRHEIPSNLFPPTLTHLTIPVIQLVVQGELPTTIIHLVIGDKEVPVKLPPRLQYLRLKGLEHPIPFGSLPHTLVHLAIGNYFNHPLEPCDLPDNLKILELGRYYSLPLPASLPSVPFLEDPVLENLGGMLSNRILTVSVQEPTSLYSLRPLNNSTVLIIDQSYNISIMPLAKLAFHWAFDANHRVKRLYLQDPSSSKKEKR
eukprot:gene13280-15609_t